MTFLQPFLLWGLPLLLIPVVIHLMNRLRYRSVRWAAMIFLLKANRNSTSMARIRQWLVLLLRTLAVCALALALARPLVGGWLGWSLSGPPDVVIVLLDRSASMGMRTKKGETLLKTAVSKLAEAGMETSPAAEIILIDSATLASIRPHSWSVLPDIDTACPTETATDVPAMLNIAVDNLIRDNSGKAEIWIASDMQRSNWRNSSAAWKDLDAKLKSLKTPPKIRLLALDGQTTDNRSLTFAAATRHPTADGFGIREITYEIHSPSDSVETDIPIVAGDDSGTRQTTVRVSPGTTRLSKRIKASVGKSGLTWGFVKLPPDGNPLDNTIFYAFGPPPKEKSLVISGNAGTAALLALAAAPSRGETASAEIVSPGEAAGADLSDAALIILDFQPSAKLADQLRSLAKKGAVVLFFPSKTVSEPETSAWKPVEKFPNDKPATVSEWNRKDGVFADTSSGDIIPLESLLIFKRSVPLYAGDGTAVLAFYNDGEPFLTRERIGDGAFYHCSTLPKPEWSNLGDGLILVPMERRMMTDGAARFAKVKFSVCSYQNTKIPDQPPTVLTSERSDSGTLSSPRLNTGVYSWSDETIAVNLPIAEVSDAVLSDREVAALTPGNKIHLFHDTGDENTNMQAEIWRVLLIVVLLALAAESLITLEPRPNLKSATVDRNA